jgi:hypothetical protein
MFFVSVSDSAYTMLAVVLLQGGGGSGYGPVVMEGDAEVRYTTQASR